MKSLLLTILLATVALGAMARPVRAQDADDSGREETIVQRRGEIVAALLQYLSQCPSGLRESALRMGPDHNAYADARKRAAQ